MDINNDDYIDKLKSEDIDFDKLKKEMAVPLIKRFIERLRFYRMVYLFVTSYREEVLNKNYVHALVKISKLIEKDGKGWIHTDFIYPQIGKGGSPSGKVSSLLTLGLIERFYTDEDIEKGIKQNGKYMLSEKGFGFLYENLEVSMKVRVTPEFRLTEGD
jgi:hypothetical protein